MEEHRMTQGGGALRRGGIGRRGRSCCMRRENTQPDNMGFLSEEDNVEEDNVGGDSTEGRNARTSKASLGACYLCEGERKERASRPANFVMKSLPVSEVASQLVKPAKSPPYPISILRSCKLDLVIANIYVKTVYFFKHNGSPNFFSSDVLTKALSQALSLYYPFAGTITADMDIECNGKGALFVQAVAHCTLADLDDYTPHPRLLQLVPATDASLEVTSQPLLLIQGVAVEHHVADGVSALSFLNAWTTIARGEAFTASPSFDKTWLRARCPPTLQFTHDEYLKLPRPSRLKEESAAEPGSEKVVGMFDLPKEFLQRVRHEVGSTFGLTTYEMLAAHVWRCCCEARALRHDEESMLVMAVDGRARLMSSCAAAEVDDRARYVGNVIFNCCVSLTVGEIGGSSVRALGKRVQAALRKTDSTYCQSAIDFLETCTKQQLQSFVKGAHTFASPNMGFISWTSFPFYESDFGWGSAVHVGPADVPWEGHAYLLRAPTTSSKGALRLCITLQRRHIPTFARLLYVLPSS